MARLDSRGNPMPGPRNDISGLPTTENGSGHLSGDARAQLERIMNPNTPATTRPESWEEHAARVRSGHPASGRR